MGPRRRESPKNIPTFMQAGPCFYFGEKEGGGVILFNFNYF